MRHRKDPVVEPAWEKIDVPHLSRQIAWSLETFGPGRRTEGLVAHIRKELEEILADPGDLIEWVDVIILAFDGAWRSGAEPADILKAIKAKQAINETRSWPDWREAPEGEPIEHVKDRVRTISERTEPDCCICGDELRNHYVRNDGYPGSCRRVGCGCSRFRVGVPLGESEYSRDRELPRPVELVFDVSEYACPKCGQHSLFGFNYSNREGSKMHTHYVCTYWASPENRADYLKPGYNSGLNRCGWHGWSVPVQEGEQG